MARMMSTMRALNSAMTLILELKEAILQTQSYKLHFLARIQHRNNEIKLISGSLMNYHTDCISNLFSNEFTEKLNWDSQRKESHAYMVKTGIENVTFNQTKLVLTYLESGNLGGAFQVLNKIPNPNLFLWTAMIRAYTKQGYYAEALILFNEIHAAEIKASPFILASVIKACAGLKTLQKGKEIHCYTISNGYESNVFLSGALVDMYAKCKRIEFACQMFNKMPQRNVVTWNVAITGYAQNGYPEEAFNLFHQMQLEEIKPNLITMIIVLRVCASLRSLQQGKEVHSYAIKAGYDLDVAVGTVLVNMYVKCRNIEDACYLFEQIPERNLVSWNVMIAGFAQNGKPEDAQRLFCQMQLEGIKPDVITWNAMIAGYAQSGCGDEALKVFDQMQTLGIKPNVVTWNSIIAGYAQNEHKDKALKSLHQMLLSGAIPNSVTVASVLPVCADIASLHHGKEIHAYMVRCGFMSDIIAGSALVDMYAKCGNVEIAHNVFDKFSRADLVLWNTMIAGYAMHGQSECALTLFNQMQKENMKPDHVTFIGVLSACSHAGLVQKGWEHFFSMNQVYNIQPQVEHYACMVDLLGRAGCLDEAHRIIINMSIQPDSRIWGALLSACRTHCNPELGEWAAGHLFQVDPDNIGSYVLLSNIYAAAGRWDDVAKTRILMRDRGLQKKPGSSWVEVKNRTHTFTAGDTSHPQMKEIYAMLDILGKQMKLAGYVPKTKFTNHDED
ncbi:pentatricopeptide repeat-containing protein At5g59600 [Cryptomeria japonica]|uniref:pentatricopeptide repeat-containing protein At5g59600 n=1 Tax=Cryptomeria japonica TaxID=3369 RepID=UPI0027DAB491|nr:pentatricopeptide repeat-containing protein At5g59600 [Cryptomeria japonica]XP_057838194.2 pentatricopeptide repeat-containing protein At5g59600 [Cryptomeria japonica]XP_057838195.2 pentatricopeptide repeat-containing protein At5g59600 [Cryptomeria japonica]XP_059067387.1 pentatricopeptide repeat-containing protein At5g59600 [Cryptomeria japonica]